MKYKVKVPDLLWYRTNILCMEACPVHTDSGKYVQLIGQGEDQEAYLVARSSNPFASVCGRICAAPCEDACRRGKIDEPITIRSLKRFITEKYGVESDLAHTQELLTEGKKSPQGSWWPLHVPSVVKSWGAKKGKKVAVIGGRINPHVLPKANDFSHKKMRNGKTVASYYIVLLCKANKGFGADEGLLFFGLVLCSL